MGGGLKDVYTSGDTVLANPVETCSIFVFVIILSAAIELALHKIEHVNNKYFHAIAEALLEEVLIVGTLALFLLFGSSLVSLPDRWVTIFNWAHISLFFMAVFFCLIITGMILSISISNKRWRRFEEVRLDTDAKLSHHEFRYKDAAERFHATLKYLRIQYPADVTFYADYAARMQRQNVVEITDLSWRSWAGLTIIVIVNALRSKLVSPTSDTIKAEDLTTGQYAWSVLSYILLCGYGTLFIFFLLSRQLEGAMKRYLTEKTKHPEPTLPSDPRTREDLVEELEDPTKELLWGSRDLTLNMIQVLIMFFEWYLSVFCLGMVEGTARHLSASKTFAGCSALIIIFALLPPVIFMRMLPWAMFCLTTLTSLGSKLELAIVDHTIRKAKNEHTTKNKYASHGHGHGHGHDKSGGGHGHGGGGHHGNHHDDDNDTHHSVRSMSRGFRSPNSGGGDEDLANLGLSFNSRAKINNGGNPHSQHHHDIL
eukprot:PhM_4_TR6327/c0_g1_i4/m.10489